MQRRVNFMPVCAAQGETRAAYQLLYLEIITANNAATWRSFVYYALDVRLVSRALVRV